MKAEAMASTETKELVMAYAYQPVVKVEKAEKPSLRG